jgi:membrane-bound lytic murein transglycosylase D
MRDYLNRHKDHLIKMKSWSGPYFNIIDNVLNQYGLPSELKYLAVIESSLKTGATSWVGATGPWQFMPETARSYGLLVNRDLDERRDYFKSTHAAAKFLLKLYQEFHDWLLVIAAYNGGAQRVYYAMRKSNSNDFWKLQYYLPVESKNHVKKFIATHYIMEGNNTYENNNPIKTVVLQNENVSTEILTGKFMSAVIAKNLSMEIKDFNLYNPDFDNRISEKGKYELTLPKDKMILFKANKYQILNESVQILLNGN